MTAQINFEWDEGKRNRLQEETKKDDVYQFSTPVKKQKITLKDLN